MSAAQSADAAPLPSPAMPPGTVFPADAPIAAIIAAIEEHGFAVVTHAADPALVDAANADFDPYLDKVQLGRTDFAGFKTRRINNLIAKSPACGRIAMHPVVMQVCDHFLLPHCVRYHLHVTSLIELGPGERAQEIHRDQSIYPVRYPAPPMTVATIWAMEDFTPINGGTNVAPGSHRWEHERKPQPHEMVATVMPRGSVLIYLGNVLHGSGTNASNATRRAMTLQYNLGWLRQEENQYLSLPPDVARTLPVELQKLVGYDFGGSYLGFVEAGHPLALTGEAPHDMARTSVEAEAAKDRVELFDIAPATGAKHTSIVVHRDPATG
ncbi:phytanoyl-CoA dioxygenase family protein [Zavarzinia sp. CC-PAN008]|uniref:phytanoyl-CoA dioxygenase family protein n=1 Tax=Zavarzinia sp. CC-PAN008 TaxID=3243332 RepID=UPI003F74A462